MELNNNIAYPVSLGTWQISNGGKQMIADYEEWDSDGNQPYAGGFAMPVFNGGCCANYWWVIWVAPGQMALRSPDKSLYIWAAGDRISPVLSLTNGSSYSEQQANRSYDPYGRFTLYNLGGGNVQIKYNGTPIGFAWDDFSWNDWGFQTIKAAAVSNSQWQDLSVSGSHMPILLLTGYGTGLNLAGMDLSENGYISSIAGTDFTGANLQKTNFSKLPNLSLAGCNFTKAEMAGVLLAGCTDIAKAIWNDVDLHGTDLSKLDLTTTVGSDFTGANLTGAQLSNELDAGHNFSYSNSKFVGAVLDNCLLQNVTLTGCDFTGASLKGAVLDGADLSGSNLTGANLSGASLKGTNLTGAQLASAHFDGCDLSGATLSATPAFGNSTATRTTFVNATNVPGNKLGLNWSYLDLTGANITAMPADLSGLKAQYTLFPTSVVLNGIILKNADFTGAQMYYANLTGADLGNSVMTGTLLKGARLIKANLSGASLKQAWLIDEAGGGDPNKYEAAQASGSFLVNTCLDGAHCDGVDFTSALFVTDPSYSTTPASADGALMNRCVFTDASVVNVSFRGTQLSGSAFDNATLVGSKFPSATLTPTTDGVDSVPTMTLADIRGTQFADVTNSGTSNAANMDGLDMRQAITSSASGMFQKVFPGFSGNVVISFQYGPTVLGTTTSATTCPNGGAGPCSISAGSASA